MSSARVPWDWLGEPLAIDFANTVLRRGHAYEDLLAAAGDVVTRAEHETGRVPAIDPEAVERRLDEVRAVRRRAETAPASPGMRGGSGLGGAGSLTPAGRGVERIATTCWTVLVPPPPERGSAGLDARANSCATWLSGTGRSGHQAEPPTTPTGGHQRS